MTDPTPGPEPTLSELLYELVGEASCWSKIDDPNDRPTVIELRATILARFGGKELSDKDIEMVASALSLWRQTTREDRTTELFLELLRVSKLSIAPTEAARDPFSHSPGQD